MRKWIYLVIISVCLAGGYIAGPKPKFPPPDRKITGLLLEGDSLEVYINRRESGIPNLKEDNEARIVWENDSTKNKTEYAVVYLHGFSASQGEGFPVHVDFAKRYGCNLYLSRLHGHGLHTDSALMDMTPKNLVNSAKEAISVGKQLGERIILMSTSTGGTLSLYLAGQDPDISGIILYSPNIKINNPFVSILTGPWGLQAGRLIAGGKNRILPIESREDSLYWNSSYRVEAVLYLQSTIELTMSDAVFASVRQPVFLGYYYKDEENQDQTVRVDAMIEMFDKLGTPGNMKMKMAFPESGDHVIACKYKSGDWEGVEESTFRFAEEILGLQPVNIDQ